ncbi:MAG TPA: right-handed parallel beta-helix repeat-containing protein, partial [Thermoanaerobaculia bacterium]|nr:right-handed parallel beta-helix repeat-containing protein [Thermoanaerobaculia bacterium]
AVDFVNGTIAKSGGRILELVGADGGGSFAGTAVTTTDHHGLSVMSSSGPFTLPALTIAAATPSPVDAVVLEDNAGSIQLGALDLATSGAGVRGLVATSGGEVSLAGATSAIASTGGAALDVTSTGTGAGWTFAAVSSTNSTGHGVRLVDVGGHVVIAGGALAGAAGTAFLVSGGSGDVVYGGAVVNTVGHAVEVVGRTVAGRSVTLSGGLSDSGLGILVQGNSAGSVVFSGPTKALSTGAATAVRLAGNTGASIAFPGGGLDVDTTSGVGFHATGGGTVEVSGAGNTVDSQTGTALWVEGVSFGSGHATFERLSAGTAAGGPTHGIVLLDTGSVGGLKVTGAGAAGSGGVVRGTGSHGVLAQETRFLELHEMVIGDPAATAGQPPDTVNHVGGAGLALASARDVRLVGVTVSRTAGHGIAGSGVDGLAIEGSAFLNNGDADGESALGFAGLSLDPMRLVGTVTIHDTVIDGFVENGIEVSNSAGSLDLTVSGSTFGNNANLLCGGGTCGENGLSVRAAGTASTSVAVTAGTLFDGVDGNGVAVFTDAAGASAEVTVADSTIADSRAFGVVLFATAGSLTFDLTGNQITGTTSTAVSIQPDGSSTMSGTVSGNAIVGSTLGRGVEVLADDASSAVVALLDNEIENTLFGVFVSVQDAAELATTVRGNRVRPLAVAPLRGGLAAHGIEVQARETSVQCLDLAGNDSLGADGGAGYRTRQRDASTFRLERFAGDGTSTAEVAAHLVAQNPSPAGQTGSATVSTTYTGVADGFCPAP